MMNGRHYYPHSGNHPPSAIAGSHCIQARIKAKFPEERETEIAGSTIEEFFPALYGIQKPHFSHLSHFLLPAGTIPTFLNCI
jgi:hypothetical protein